MAPTTIHNVKRDIFLDKQKSSIQTPQIVENTNIKTVTSTNLKPESDCPIEVIATKANIDTENVCLPHVPQL